MHLLTTNKLGLTFDVYRFAFGSAGALEIANEYSGLAVAPAHLYCFRRSHACMPHYFNLTYWRDVMREQEAIFYSAYVGIDWADSKHDVCVQQAKSNAREFDVIQHRTEAIDTWVKGLHRRYGGTIAVAVELSKGPIVSALQKYDFIDIFPVNPSTLAKYREAFQPSKAKDDPTDAEIAMDMLLRHPEHFKLLKPQSAEMRALATMVEQRRRMVGERIRITNRLRCALKEYYPQVLEWFDRIDTPLFCEFVKHWPTLTQAKRARATTLRRFFHEHHMYHERVIERRLQAIKGAQPLTLDQAIILPYRIQALVLVEQLELMFKAIGQFDTEIEKLASAHPDYRLFQSFPGAGPSLAPRLLVAFGEQRDRFKSAAEIQKYSGIAPVTERSGQKHWVHWRLQCPTFLRQTFVEWAAQTINKSYWAGEYYQQQRAKGSTYQAAVRALAFKWIRIVYRCWQTGVEYDESRYLKALERSGSPLLQRQARLESA
jgi:transposase